MNNPIFSELVGKFNTNIIIKEIVPFGNGHINDTYLVTTSPAEAPDYMLQRKNHKIFKDVPGMMKNIVITTNHIRNKLIASGEKEVDRKVMTYIPAKDGNMFVNDNEGNFWTLFLFIADCKVVENIQKPDQAFRAAQAFGHFQQQLSDLPGEELIETIPNFHNGISRLFDFCVVVGNSQRKRFIIQPPLQGGHFS